MTFTAGLCLGFLLGYLASIITMAVILALR